MPVEICRRFDAEPGSVGEARRLLLEVEDCMVPAAFESLQLVVSELVTNVIRHSRLGKEAWIGVRVTVSEAAVRGEISEPTGGFEVPQVSAPAPDRAPGGWGLYLVDRSVDRWGVVREESSRVWFEIDLPDRTGEGS
ncbi:MAG: ATP-binding protein [Rubrobacter sp.]|nr:ATP-binding protein [Rubrobacter sp.]